MIGIASTMATLLAAVFLFAAVGKFLAPQATVRDFDALGVPFASTSARLVPAGEILVAFALLTAPRLGSVLAAATLMGFTAVLLRVLATGREVSCGCLGSLWNRGSQEPGQGDSGNPVSALTIARNGVLMAMAGTAALTPSVIIPDFASIAASTTLLGAAALAIQLWALRRATGRIWSVNLAGEAAIDLDSDLVSGGA